MTLVTFIQLIIAYATQGTWCLLFLTHWGLHFTFFSLTLTYHATNDQKQNPGKVSGLMFLRWRCAVWMYEVAICAEVVLTTLFWVLLYNPPKEFTPRWAYFLSIHITPVAFLLIDFCMQRWVFRFNHISLVLFMGIVYAVFNYSYVKLSGRYIYPILKWDDTSSFVLIFAAIVMLCAVFTLLYLFTLVNEKTKERNQCSLLQRPTDC